MSKTNIKVKLIGESGNAFVVMGKVVAALKRNGYKSLVDQYIEEATGGDYNHLLRVTMQYVEVE